MFARRAIYVKHLGKMNIHFVLFVLLFLRTESSHEKLKYDPLDATLYPTVGTRADSRFSLISVAYMHLSLFRVCLSAYLYLNVSYICGMSVYVLWAICVSLSLSLSPSSLPICHPAGSLRYGIHCVILHLYQSIARTFMFDIGIRTFLL